MRGYWIIAAWCIFATSTYAQTIIHGIVLDAQTGQALPRANIAAPQAGIGVMTSDDGTFRLNVATLPVTLHLSYIGYQTQQVQITSTDSPTIRLNPAPVELAETLVSDTDPAQAIMRRVIDAKRQWTDLAKNHRGLAYTRQTLYSNNAIIASRETLAEVFWDQQQGRREWIKAQAASANVPAQLQRFAASAYFFDLYQNEIILLDQSFIGPTHPQALTHYTFQLTQEKTVNSRQIAYISVQPRSAARALFAGYVAVALDEDALIEAVLQPNRRVYFPPVETELGFDFSLKQRFDRFVPGVWLPIETTYQINAKIGASALEEPLNQVRGGATPQALLKGTTRFTAYDINEAEPAYAYSNPQELVVDRAAPTWDKFLQDYRQHMPLTQLEELAYSELAQRDNALTTRPAAALFTLYKCTPYQRQAPAIRYDPFKEKTLVSDEFIKGLIATHTGIFIDSTISLGGYRPVKIPAALRGKFTSELWANRVDALHFGLRWTGQNLRRERLGIYLKGGYNTGHGRWFSGLGGRHVWGKYKQGFSGLYFQQNTASRYPSAVYSLSDNSYPFLLSLDDYFDFYWRQTWRAESSYSSKNKHQSFKAGLNWEKHASLDKETNFNLLCSAQRQSGRIYKFFCQDRDHAHRPNPPVRAGRLAAVDLKFKWQDALTKAQRQMTLDAEYSPGGLISDFSFARLAARLDWHYADYKEWFFLPDESNYRAVGGTALGTLPIQRYSALDAGLSLLSPFGTFHTQRNRPYEGKHYAALFWEHRWGAGVWESLKLGSLANRWGLGWTLHGASGRTWIPAAALATPTYQPRYTDQFHHEAGLSLTVMDRFNVDFTRRLDRADWRWGLSWRRTF
jgi:hypothetical protein